MQCFLNSLIVLFFVIIHFYAFPNYVRCKIIFNRKCHLAFSENVIENILISKKNIVSSLFHIFNKIIENVMTSPIFQIY